MSRVADRRCAGDGNHVIDRVAIQLRADRAQRLIRSRPLLRERRAGHEEQENEPFCHAKNSASAPANYQP